MGSKPTITICSDASFSPSNNIGTWACYIRTPSKVMKTSGVLKEKTEDSYKAERLGLANALFLANKIADLEKHRLIIYCDNVGAIKDWSSSKNLQNEKRIEKKQWFDKNIKPFLEKAAEYELRHVKAHLPKEQWDKTSKRNYMNDWCDKEAQRLRKREVDKIIKDNGV